MSANDGLRQASARAITGAALDYDGDWHALFDRASIPAGTFDGRLLAWINAQLGTAYAEVNGAMAAYAQSQGCPGWGQMGAFAPGGEGAPILAEAGGEVLTEAGADLLME